MSRDGKCLTDGAGWYGYKGWGGVGDEGESRFQPCVGENLRCRVPENRRFRNAAVDSDSSEGRQEGRTVPPGLLV